MEYNSFPELFFSLYYLYFRSNIVLSSEKSGMKLNIHKPGFISLNWLISDNCSDLYVFKQLMIKEFIIIIDKEKISLKNQFGMIVSEDDLS